MRVLAVFKHYPTLSQTYKENELRALLTDHEVRIASIGGSKAMYRHHLPYDMIEQSSDLDQIVAEFQPEVIHGHYLHQIDILHEAAEKADIRFTLRTHSFDVLGLDDDGLRRWLPYVTSDRCAGILAFPFLAERLLKAGYPEDKVVEDWPVVPIDRFYDTSPNQEGILNMGACIPKKNMPAYLALAQSMPERRFSLCPIGFNTERLQDLNRRMGSPVTFHPTVEPEAMPAVYKQHDWLVYTADRQLASVGWPMAIAEAQASGLGILMQNIRPDLRQFIGPAGFLFDDIHEARRILSQPYPLEMREAGFEHCRKSDIQRNIGKLTSLWTLT